MQNTDLTKFFRSVIEQDRCAVVICNLAHEIIYMNPAAISRYARRGGAKLLGQNLLDCHNAESGRRIEEVVAWFRESADHNLVYTSHNAKENKDVYMVALRDEDGTLIGYYEKHEYRDPEQGEFYHF
ncbi:MAG: PAS domain-containing protein [Clostridium sp.]|nr:PAS domain-containing protein [Acetatifactor muris]MCM1527482.1 PAS domain-containing protein [Bacteroides sp.]MCM1562074.1 PAS domain-containing protein [Clostridium sp.]